MNERRRPPRRGRGPRPFRGPPADPSAEPNPYRNSDGGASETAAPEGGSSESRSESSAGSAEPREPGGLSQGGVSQGGMQQGGFPQSGAGFPPGGYAQGGYPQRGPGDGSERGDRHDRGDRGHQNGRRQRRVRGRGGPRRDGERQGAPVAVVTAEGEATGWFDSQRDGGYLRRAANSYLGETGDPYVPPHIVRQFAIRRGDSVDASVGRDQRGRVTVAEVLKVNGEDPAVAAKRPDFSSLVASYPDRKLFLETGRPAKGGPELTRRAIDLIAPVGFGQRALIVAPARAGKTMLLHAITEGVALNHPGAVLLILLVDERPEEVSEAISWGVGEVIASSFDQPAERHVEVTEMVLEHARRLVEGGKDVVIVLDSLTRMARAHNTAERGTGRTLSGGLDATAMAKPKAFFGSARAVAPQHGGGSLTIIATALVETGSRMDDVIFEEFKGTGNCEIKLDRSLAEKRIFPAIDIATSGTRREEKLFRPDQLEAVYTLRRGLQQMPPQAGMEWLIKRIAGTQNNDTLLSGL